jgi:hypothetical protein
MGNSASGGKSEGEDGDVGKVFEKSWKGIWEELEKKVRFLVLAFCKRRPFCCGNLCRQWREFDEILKQLKYSNTLKFTLAFVSEHAIS